MKLKVYLTALLLSLFSWQVSAAPKVVTSIKPLQLIAAAVLKDIAEADVLLPPGSSPHHYALKPSDVRKLAKADLIIWIGPDLEVFLSKTVQNSETDVLTLLPGEFKEEEHHEESEDGHGHHHHDHEQDPHLWMDPIQVMMIAEKMAAHLSEKHPEHKAQLMQNVQQFSAELVKLDRQLHQQFEPVTDKGFYVFHDAYQSFTSRYGLKQLGYFTVDPGRPVGTRHLAEIRQKLVDNQVVCVFGEPQFKAKVVAAVTDDLDVGYAELDPLAIDIPSTPEGYKQYLKWLAGQLQQCLSSNG